MIIYVRYSHDRREVTTVCHPMTPARISWPISARSGRNEAFQLRLRPAVRIVLAAAGSESGGYGTHLKTSWPILQPIPYITTNPVLFNIQTLQQKWLTQCQLLWLKVVFVLRRRSGFPLRLTEARAAVSGGRSIIRGSMSQNRGRYLGWPCVFYWSGFIPWRRRNKSIYILYSSKPIKKTTRYWTAVTRGWWQAGTVDILLYAAVYLVRGSCCRWLLV